jgi:type II secretory pathway pseudopilin PulG
MLVVVALIVALAAIALPSVQGLSHTNVMAAATQQLMDDIALARQTAINNHTTVYMLFVPTNVYFMDQTVTATHKLDGKAYVSYALYSDRSVGSQPGQGHPQYLTEWKTLPEGVFIAPSKYDFTEVGIVDEDRPFLAKPPGIQFPVVASTTTTTFPIPCLAFDYTGTLVNPAATGQPPTTRDQVIPLTRGSIFFHRLGNSESGTPVADIVLAPPGNGNSETNFNRIRVNWLTGRCRVERPAFQ